MGPWAILGLGITAHVLMLASQLLLPKGIALDTISQIWKPVMAVFPAATLMMGLLMGNEERRVMTEKSLRESKASLHIAQKIARMGSWEYNLQSDEVDWSENTPFVFGLTGSHEEFAYKDFTNVVIPEDKHLILESVDTINKRKAPMEVELRVKDSRQNIRYIHNKLIPVLDNGEVSIIKGVSMDVTESRMADIQLKNNLKEKEILLKEIHHRVKNNLNVIISLLNMQSRSVRTKNDALKGFKEIRDRIFSMSLVHAKLYKSDNFSRIDMKDYIETITRHYIQASELNRYIDSDIRVDSVFLDINTAIPCGLIINELMTNIFKHAFPDKKKGKIYIRFQALSDNQLELLIGDNGVGLGDEIDFNHSETLGLRIVHLLIDQIQGSIEVIRNKGTVFKIIFPVKAM